MNPNDPRYADAIGKEVVVPVVGRRVPVIADERVEIDFGSGALKITPGHDPTDFDIGRDHDLPVLTILGPDGRVTAEGFEGLDAGRGRRARRRLAQRARPAREARALPALGRHVRALPHADRAARLAAVVVRDGRARAPGDRGAARRAASSTTPRASTASRSSRSSRRPTGASRASSGGATRSRSGRAPTATGPARGRSRARAPSAARPSSCATPTCSTRGSRRRSGRSRRSAGPSETPELERYYPGDVNVTAREIIRLWENRMIFSGLFLLGEIPFTDVIITSTVLARRRPADVEVARHRASTRSRPCASTAPTRRATAC